MIEQQADDERKVIESLQQAVIRWQRRRASGIWLSHGGRAEEYDAFRRFTRRVSPTLYRVQGAERPTPFIEDIAVPPDPPAGVFVTTAEHSQSARSHRVALCTCRPWAASRAAVLNLGDPEHVREMQALADELYEEVWKVGGTISGEHGSGLSRTAYCAKQFGPLCDVFREVKRIFDPQNVLNPGKVLADAPPPLTKALRIAAPSGSF